MNYDIMRTVAGVTFPLRTVTPAGKQKVKAMGENTVEMQFTLSVYVDFKIRDFVIIDGERYNINLTPAYEKLASRKHQYNIQFEHEFYDLAKVQLQFLNATNGYLEPTFNLMANAEIIIDLIVTNINRDYSGWSVGVVDVTDFKLYSFSAQNCLQVLHQLAADNNTELWIDNKIIHLQKREQSSGLTFAYGQGNGLYNIRRQNKTNTNIVTRLYVRGSSENLPIGYRDYAGSLLLPGGLTYIQDNAKVAMYGLIEATQNFDIKPEREGSVTGVVAGAGNWKYFTDSTIDFDVNTVTLADAAKIVFNTGQLAGYTFTIAEYNHATKTFTINKNEDEKDLDVPSDLFRPAIGDKYVIVNIQMPQAYIDNAEARLLAAGQNYYDKNSDPKFLLSYAANCDPLFIRQNNVQVVLGNTAIITDGDMGLNAEVRIASYVRDLQDRDLYDEVEWSDTIGGNEIVRQYAQQQRTLQLIQNSGLLDVNQVRKNIFLNRLSELNGYLLLAGVKVKAGIADYAIDAAHAAISDYALDADKWDGRQFADYLNQPLRKADGVEFLSVTSDTLNSKVFVSGFTGQGYKINPDGSAEFDSLTIRKDLNINVLNVREITGNGGSLAITNVAKIKEVVDHGTYYRCTINTDDNTIGVQLRTNDVIRCQIWDGKKLKYYSAIVTGYTADAFTLSKASFVGGSVPQAGDTVFQFGNTTDANRQGLIYLTNSDNGAPYIDVLDGITSDNLSGKTKVRLGKLNGIVDADFGALDGYGFYGQNVFVKGKIMVTGGNAATLTNVANAKSEAITTATTLAQADATAKASAAQVAAISAAATDASNKANAAQSAASSDATAKAAAAQSAAQTYAAAQAAYEREIAKAYADGIVDAEEAARIADVAAKLQAAKDDATTKVNNAYAAANGYTDSKAVATLSAAQTYADSSATSKANVAQANAISQASTDAQNKANAAQAAAALLSQQLVDGIKVGGRNYILNSKFLNGTNGWGAINDTEILQIVNGRLRVTATGNGQYGLYGLQIKFPIGKVTLSAKLYSSTGFTLFLYESYFGTSANYTADGDVVVLTFENTDPNYQYRPFVFANGQAGNSFEVEWIKYEVGGKATDWTPAPEDVQAAIDLAKSTADIAQANYSALTNNLKSMAYLDVVELAKLGTTVIEGGKIKATLIDADYIRANIVNAGYINTLELDAAAIKSGTIDSARINAAQIISNGNGATINFVNTSITTATTQAQADAAAKASAAQVAAILEAALDATTKVNAAQSAALSDATAKAAAAQAAAQTYAAAQAAYEREIAKAYADGIVDIEEAARIAQAATNLQNAKDDATAKVNTAIASANGYTDTKALATISAAQTYADSASQTKANAAQANAISLASTDAQNKANAAQAAAASLSQQLVDGIKVGGRNYILNSKFLNGISGWGGNNGTEILSVVNGRLRVASNGNGQYGVYGNQIKFPIGKITLSAKLYSSTGFTLFLYESYFGNSANYTADGDVVVLTFENTDPNYQYRPFVFANGQAGSNFEIEWIKYEVGGKATDWTPAPEDVQAAIDLAKSKADAAQANYTALTANLKSLAYLDVVELAKLGTTVIEGGKIKTTLLDADYIRANIVNAGYINTLELVTKNLKTSATGKRVEIDSVENNIRIIDADGNNLIIIDDDAALERVVHDNLTTPPTNYYYYGPGIRVGSPQGRSSSLSRNGLVVMGSDGNQKFKVGDRTGNGDWRIMATGLEPDPLSADYGSDISFTALNGVFDLRKADGGTVKVTFIDGLLMRIGNPTNIRYWNDVQYGYSTFGPCNGYDPEYGNEVGSQHNAVSEANTFSSTVSKAAANAAAQADAQARAETDAANNGYCFYQ